MTDPMAWLSAAAEEVVPDPVVADRGRAPSDDPSVPWAWMNDAACLGMDPDLFYPEGPTVPIPEEVIAACRRCTVRDACLDHALHHEKQGYWGGQSAEGRRRLRKALRITVSEPLALDPAVFTRPLDPDPADDLDPDVDDGPLGDLR